jgi:hypothetical protein
MAVTGGLRESTSSVHKLVFHRLGDYHFLAKITGPAGECNLAMTPLERSLRKGGEIPGIAVVKLERVNGAD